MASEAEDPIRRLVTEWREAGLSGNFGGGPFEALVREVYAECAEELEAAMSGSEVYCRFSYPARRPLSGDDDGR